MKPRRRLKTCREKMQLTLTTQCVEAHPFLVYDEKSAYSIARSVPVRRPNQLPLHSTS